jgi:beta-ketodecanoyl-[acyl-carrier-protein] synthase
LHQAVIAATGLYTPPHSLSNAELVETFNAYVERFNATNAQAIEAGEVAALTPSSVEFIERPRASSRGS